MKRLFLLSLFLLLSTDIIAQKFQILKDDMSDKEYMVIKDKEITYSGESRSKGVVWGMSCLKKGDIWVAKGLSLKIYGLSCLENTEVIILFEDGSKIITNQWNDFNCEENVWTDLDETQLNQLKTLPIKKIRVTNKRNFESYDFTTVSSSMRVYYNKLLNSLEEGNSKGFETYVEEE
jgi:hypothetical protein